MTATVPIFDISDHFDTALAIGEQQLPVRIKNMSRAELAEFKKQFTALFVPRGATDAPMDDAAAEQRAVDRAAFCDRWIRECLTLPSGVLRFKGQDVTDGNGFIQAFHAREDVLADAVVKIYTENHLGSVIRKNSNSPRDSGTGSEASSQARGGERPAPTVAPADGSASVSSAPAAEGPDSSEDGPSSSGATRSDEERSVH